MLPPIATIQYLSSGSEFFLHGYHSIEIFKFFFYPKWLDKTQESKTEKEHELEIVITILWLSPQILLMEWCLEFLDKLFDEAHVDNSNPS
jgi:hypothetical protein